MQGSMNQNRAASYIWVFLDDTLTAAFQAEAIRRLAEALGLTIVREYEGKKYGPSRRPQFRQMMDEAKSEGKPFGAIIAYHCLRFTGGAAGLTDHVTGLQEAESGSSRRGTGPPVEEDSPSTEGKDRDHGQEGGSPGSTQDQPG
jgi:hypothetical protein